MFSWPLAWKAAWDAEPFGGVLYRGARIASTAFMAIIVMVTIAADLTTLP